jgi:hypothetical protein
MKTVIPAELWTVSKVRFSMPALKLSAKTGTAQNKTKVTINRFIAPPIAGWDYASREQRCQYREALMLAEDLQR